jgi:hypothetical protein
MPRKVPYKDPAGDMAKSQLQKIEMYAAKLNDMIHPDDELESWVQSKLARISTDIGDVKHYLDYELKKMADGGTTGNVELNSYNVGFKYEKENDEDAVKIVKVVAESKAEAERIAEEKFKPYYDDFEIVEINYLKHGGEITVQEMMSARNEVGEDVWKSLSYKDKLDVTEYLIMKGYIEEVEDEIDMEYIPSMEESAAMQYKKGGVPHSKRDGVEHEMLQYQYQKHFGRKAPKWFVEMPLDKKKLVIKSVKK